MGFWLFASPKQRVKQIMYTYIVGIAAGEFKEAIMFFGDMAKEGNLSSAPACYIRRVGDTHVRVCVFQYDKVDYSHLIPISAINSYRQSQGPAKAKSAGKTAFIVYPSYNAAVDALINNDNVFHVIYRNRGSLMQIMKWYDKTGALNWDVNHLLLLPDECLAE